jgi:filamentous hemagglutinin
MNSNQYRIVFNRARGQLMAVAETASSHAGGPGQHARPGKRNSSRLRERAPHLRATAAAASWFVAAFRVGLGALSVSIMVPCVHAQIVADPTAPANQRPVIVQDSAGRPQVNIQTPSAGGVSRNTYSQFDVQAKGAVLNNDRATNTSLAAGAAKVILNEVNSTNPSLLNGPITVSGTRAQVIVANPAGIKVDGGSFINASRATLTTGAAVMDNGKLTGFDVRQGTVEVTGSGLSVVNVPYTDILARAAKLTGSINAGVEDEIAVTTGTQTVDFTTGQITAIEGSGAKPTLAIDTSVLGGMYAGKITLLATEAGVGVRNAGKLQGYANGTSQIILTADGRLENVGTVSAAVTSVATISGDIVNSGVLKGSKAVLASSGADLRLSGNGLVQDEASASSVMLHAQRDIIAAGANVASIGSLTAADGVVTGGQVGMTANRHIDVSGAAGVRANGNVRMQSAGRVSAKDITVSSLTSDVVVVSEQGINLSNVSATGRRIQLETGAPFKETKSGIAISGGKLQSTDQLTVLATGDLTVSDIGKDAINSLGGLQMKAEGTTLLRTDLSAEGGQHISSGKSTDLIGENVFVGGVDISAGENLNLEATMSSVMASSMVKGNPQTIEAVKLKAGKHLSVYSPGSTSLNGVDIAAQSVSVAGTTNLSLSYWEGFIGSTKQTLGSRITSRAMLKKVRPGV